MKGRIAVLGGDGIGPEVVAEGVRVLEAVASRHGHVFELEALPFGGVAIDAFGDGLPEHTLEGCVAADGVLLGAIGGPKWGPDAPVRPEPALLRLRAELGVYANLRPIAVQQALRDASPIKPEYLDGVDLLFVRELTGGIYFGRKWREGARAFDECAYSVSEIERITRVAGRLAASRRGKITQVDKSNVLETSRLWRTVSERVIRTEFPGVKIEHMFVDAAAMHLIRRPRDFDVILTENLFGDILTDEGAMLAGSLGVLPSAALALGMTGSAFDSFLALRGLRTLHARIGLHEANANALAHWLAAQRRIRRVYYPGLASHGGHDLARRQQRGFGAMISIELEGGTAAVKKFVSALKLFSLAESLGGVESLIAHPATMTHAAMEPAARAAAGLVDGLLRLSIGIEAERDLRDDLADGLAALA
ncbi:MAG: 3-isopropylmalate dehydrogenase, partial [Gammaproteobacteria bacterium]|nr:3-isopropylmalate dehydrogenase [Gammaproteobacteria bacterium]